MGAIFKSAEIGVRQTEQGMHRHKYAELYVSLGGRTTDVVNGCEVDTLPFDVFVLTSEARHGQINTDEYRYCIFKFDMDALVTSLGDFARERGFQSLFVIDPSLREGGERSANMCIDLYTARYVEMSAEMLGSLGEGDTADALFSSLVMLISERAGRREIGTRDVISEVVFYMNVHYKEEISVGELALRYGYSARHLTRLFDRYMGSSPIKYLSDLRLTRASELLACAQMNVTEIAVAVGIPDSSLFAKSFRRKFGITPTEYRKRSIGI
jgi:AraC-like DNA-binding protein